MTNRVASRDKKMVKIHRAAMEGKWEEFVEQARNVPMDSPLNENGETALHIATLARQETFVKKLLGELNKEMLDKALKATNNMGNNALTYAAACRNLKIVKMLMPAEEEKLRHPPTGRPPLLMAAIVADPLMVEYLFERTSFEKWTPGEMIELFHACIDMDLFGVPLKMLRFHRELARSLNKREETALFVLACKPCACRNYKSQAAPRFKRLFYSFENLLAARADNQNNSGSQDEESQMNSITNEVVGHERENQPVESHVEGANECQPAGWFRRLLRPCPKPSRSCQALELVEKLLEPHAEENQNNSESHAEENQRVGPPFRENETPSESQEEENPMSSSSITNEEVDVPKLLYAAAEVGNVDFIVKLIQMDPDVIWTNSNQKGSIFHIAVEKRHEKIFNLLFELGSIKDFIIEQPIAVGKNNLLHLAAKLAPQEKLDAVCGAALQMQRELLWFTEVEKIVPPSDKHGRNSDKKTPREVFVEEHKDLREKAEKWMRGTAESSTVVAALIATVMFTAAINVPGGFKQSGEDDPGVPVLLRDKAFKFFFVAVGVAMFSSSTSMLMFLSILTSRYAEKDILWRAPCKMLIGLASLFISITAMMGALSITFFVYDKKIAWISVILFFLPFIYMLLVASLFVDLIGSVLRTWFLFGPSGRLFH